MLGLDGKGGKGGKGEKGWEGEKGTQNRDFVEKYISYLSALFGHMAQHKVTWRPRAPPVAGGAQKPGTRVGLGTTGFARFPLTVPTHMFPGGLSFGHPRVGLPTARLPLLPIPQSQSLSLPALLSAATQRAPPHPASVGEPAFTLPENTTIYLDPDVEIGDHADVDSLCRGLGLYTDEAGHCVSASGEAGGCGPLRGAEGGASSGLGGFSATGGVGGILGPPGARPPRLLVPDGDLENPLMADRRVCLTPDIWQDLVGGPGFESCPNTTRKILPETTASNDDPATVVFRERYQAMKGCPAFFADEGPEGAATEATAATAATEAGAGSRSEDRPSPQADLRLPSRIVWRFRIGKHGFTIAASVAAEARRVVADHPFTAKLVFTFGIVTETDTDVRRRRPVETKYLEVALAPWTTQPVSNEVALAAAVVALLSKGMATERPTLRPCAVPS